VGDKIGVSRNLHNIGELYYEREMYIEALKSFEESLPISAETGWREGYAQNLIYVGYLKFITNSAEEDEGREVILEGISLSEKSNFNRSVPLGKYFLALTYVKDNDSAKAEDCFREAMQIAENTGFKKMIDDISAQLSKLHTRH
jgi:tetratricopeptide (TPR) repeat protein